MIMISILQPLETSGKNQSVTVPCLMRDGYLQEESVTKMDHSFRVKVTWPMSLAELRCYATPPFASTHHLWMNPTRWPILRGLQAGVRDVHQCIYRIRACKPTDTWSSADTLLVPKILCELQGHPAAPGAVNWGILLDSGGTWWDRRPEGSLTRAGPSSIWQRVLATIQLLRNTVTSS